MKPYSKDLRVKVLAAVDRGMPRKKVARIFGVSEPTIRRYLRLHRQTGDVEPRPVPGSPARKRGRRWKSACRHRFVSTPTSPSQSTASSSRKKAAWRSRLLP
jgi:transposase